MTEECDASTMSRVAVCHPGPPPAPGRRQRRRCCLCGLVDMAPNQQLGDLRFQMLKSYFAVKNRTARAHVHCLCLMRMTKVPQDRSRRRLFEKGVLEAKQRELEELLGSMTPVVADPCEAAWRAVSQDPRFFVEQLNTRTRSDLHSLVRQMASRQSKNTTKR